ncbi:MAG: efflux RND transporter periplasmic adaptor subunit [Gemmatimonadaceae bacterium]
MQSLRALNKRQILVPVGVTALLVTIVAWLSSGLGGEGGAGSDETVVVSRRPFAATVSALGAVKARIGAEVRVGSRISGRVRRLRANIGDRVAQGQVLAELETADLDALVAQRRAEVKVAESRLAAIDAMTPSEEARAQLDVDRLSAAAKTASDDWVRQQALLRERVTTGAEADAARERHNAAQAQLEAARRALHLERTGNVEGRKQADADLERSRAALLSAQVDRSFAVITAPISGIVASVATQEGETVAAGLSAPTFLTIVDLGRLQVNAFVDEVDIGKVQPGQAAAFTVDAFPARDFSGHVTAIYPSATIQDNVVKYIVAIDIAGDYAGSLRPEMTTSVRIRIAERSVLALPARAIRREDGSSVAYVVSDGRARSRAVRLGWRDGNWVEIVEGLKEGERVLIDPPAPALSSPR